MQVTIGNQHAIEGYRIPESADPEKLHYRRVSGEQETTFWLNEGTSVSEALLIVTETLPLHMDLSEGPPAWIETEDAVLKRILCQHYNISEKKRRPARWGDGTHSVTKNEEN